ncbi:MAG: NAD(P)-dependent oxidoreductase [Acidimicrobiia bacterium]|nr:NAD(P)-dependent oxidoreductase [Acidimicrobiia bacterium]
MMRRLERLRGDDELRVALVGAGMVGHNLTYQINFTPGMRTALIVNRTTANAVDAYRKAGLSVDDIVVSDDPATLSKAMQAGKPAVTTSAEAMCELDEVEIVMECSGSAEHGADVTRTALEAGLDVVTMNAEADATVGYLLKTVADANNVVYTLADGDQPGVLARLIEFVASSGFEVVSAVNCKGFMDVHATPESIKEWSVKQGTSLPMTTSFTDGTKMNIEQANLANAFDLHPEVRGMRGVKSTLATVTEDMVAALDGHGTVEYTIGGDFAGGVFVLAHSDNHEMIQPALRFLKMGDGPYYTFYRPYHLVHIEAPVSIAEVYLDKEPTIAPAGPFVTDVIAMAKRDLVPGDMLDGIGGWTTYGEIDSVENADGFLIVGLTEHARIVKPVAMDEPIPLDAVELDDSIPIVKDRIEQDAL